MPDEDIHTSRECGGQVKTPSSLTNELHGQLQLLPCWGLQSPAIHVFRTFYPADFRQRVGVHAQVSRRKQRDRAAEQQAIRVPGHDHLGSGGHGGDSLKVVANEPDTIYLDPEGVGLQANHNIFDDHGESPQFTRSLFHGLLVGTDHGQPSGAQEPIQLMQFKQRGSPVLKPVAGLDIIIQIRGHGSLGRSETELQGQAIGRWQGFVEAPGKKVDVNLGAQPHDIHRRYQINQRGRTRGGIGITTARGQVVRKAKIAFYTIVQILFFHEAVTIHIREKVVLPIWEGL